MPPHYRVVFLDVGETLIGFANADAVYRQALAALDLHHELEDIQAASRAAFGAAAAEGYNPPAPPDYAIDAAAQLARRERLVRSLLGHLGVEERLDEAVEAIFHTWTGPVFELYPETLSVLDRLRAEGYVVAVISNWDPRLEQVLRNTGLIEHFDFLVVSEVEGYAKPAARLFQTALERAGATPEEAIHVGDSYSNDVEGARGVGIQPVWLDRSAEGAEAHAPTIHSLDELFHVLERRVPLRGVVTSVEGSVPSGLSLPQVERQVASALGFVPSDRTISLRLERRADLAAWEAIRALSSPLARISSEGVAGQEDAGDVQLWHARRSDGSPAAILLPLARNYPTDLVEVLTPRTLPASGQAFAGELLTLYVAAS